MTNDRYPSDHGAAGAAACAEIPVSEVTDGTPLPLVCRWPARSTPKAFVVFCHGLGASGRHYAELSQYWASHGYLVIHPTFADWVGAVVASEPELGIDPASDLDGWAADGRIRPRMYEILHTPFYWLERIRIVREVLDRLNAVFTATCGPPSRPLRGAIAGHSFGAHSAQLFAGAEIDLPGAGARNFKDDRFAAAILLSAQGRDQQGLREGSWRGVAGPMMNVTGTLDGGAKGQDWHWKVEPYAFAPPADKYLAVLTGADHYLGGIARPTQSPVPIQRKAVKQLTLAFLDAYLTDDLVARTWMGNVSDRVADCPLLFCRK